MSFEGGNFINIHCALENSLNFNLSYFRLQTQSPGRRLSHLAKRRTVFSSANLKSSGLASQSTSGGQLFIDR